MKKIPLTLFTLLLPLFYLSGCIGTDIIDDPRVPPRLTIEPRIDNIDPGDSIQFTATYKNELGLEEPTTVTWSSTEPSHVSVSATGLAHGIIADSAQIIASADGIQDTLILNTDGVSNVTLSRTGMLQGKGGYTATGTVTLEAQPDGSLKLLFASDFVASAGPSIYIMLANHTGGSYTVTPGSNAVNSTSAQITANRVTDFSGAMEFDVPAGVAIDDFDFVVLYCVIGPVFGHASFE